MQQKTVKKKLVLKSSIRNFITRVLLAIIVFLIGLILIKQNPNLKTTFIKNIYEKNFKFTKAKQLYQKYFGNILAIEKMVKEEQAVFNENLNYSKKENYKDGVALTVENKYMVPVLESGIVVFIGQKEGYDNCVVIEQINGIDVTYGNISTSNIKLYDYIEKGKLLGEVKSNKLYLIFQKDGQNLDYKKYI